MLKGRSLTYEIQACRDGRWTIEGACGHEAEALAAARARLASEAVQAVKVVRVRAMPTGFATRTDILHERRPETTGRPMLVTGGVERAPACSDLADLYGLDARRLMGRLFRRFLDQFQVTPTELLHNGVYARKLTDTGTLVATALHQVAQAQARESGAPLKERLSALQGLVGRALARVRALEAERGGAPAFESGKLIRLSREVRTRHGADDHDFVMRALLCRHLMGAGSIGGKMEAVLALIAAEPEPGLAPLFEGAVADALGSAETVKALLGPQDCLGASLAALADFLQGRAEPAGAPEPMRRIGGLIRAGLAPECRAVLLDRLLAELGRDANPLDRKNPERDAALLDRIEAALRSDAGEFLGGAAAEKAIARRKLRARQAMLRRLGLEEQAVALGAELRALHI